jgi:hypothetical protein
VTRTASRITVAELRRLARQSPTMDLPTAGSAFGLGVNASYAAHQRGEFPCRVLRLGRKLRVPSAEVLHALGLDAETDYANPDDTAA